MLHQLSTKYYLYCLINTFLYVRMMPSNVKSSPALKKYPKCNTKPENDTDVNGKETNCQMRSKMSHFL